MAPAACQRGLALVLPQLSAKSRKVGTSCPSVYFVYPVCIIPPPPCAKSFPMRVVAWVDPGQAVPQNAPPPPPWLSNGLVEMT